MPHPAAACCAWHASHAAALAYGVAAAVEKLATAERVEVTPSVVLATPETTYAVPAVSPLTLQLANWLDRQVVLGQASQLGAPLLGLGHTDST